MLKLNTLYRPLTSRPFLSNDLYREYAPCSFLRPYISCFWEAGAGTAENMAGSEPVLIIPDTCMDIIIKVDHRKQKVHGYFSGLQDCSFFSASDPDTGVCTSFAIRFYFWAAHLFLDLDFREARNKNVELEALGPQWRGFLASLARLEHTSARIACAEAFLLRRLEEIKWNHNLFNAIHSIVSVQGRSSLKDICAYSCVSQRQLERLFLHYVGLPPKRIASLVRYQNVWRDMVSNPAFDIQDAVYHYGYTDQAHLLNEFKRFHGIAPREAKRIAWLNQ